MNEATNFLIIWKGYGFSVPLFILLRVTVVWQVFVRRRQFCDYYKKNKATTPLEVVVAFRRYLVYTVCFNHTAFSMMGQ